MKGRALFYVTLAASATILAAAYSAHPATEQVSILADESVEVCDNLVGYHVKGGCDTVHAKNGSAAIDGDSFWLTIVVQENAGSDNNQLCRLIVTNVATDEKELHPWVIMPSPDAMKEQVDARNSNSLLYYYEYECKSR